MDIYRKVEAGERLSAEDGLRLCRTKNLTAVGYLANVVRERKHGNRTYFVRNQHINYTNICNKFCKFCSFYAKMGGPTDTTHDHVLTDWEALDRFVAALVDHARELGAPLAPLPE